MATLSAFIAELEIAIDAIAGGTRSRMSQDYGNETPEFAALDTTLYQIQATYLNIINEFSDAPSTLVEVEVFVHHAISTFGVEQAYTSGQMATDQLALIQDSFWESMSSVFELVAGFPALNAAPERTGKRITYSVGAQLQLA